MTLTLLLESIGGGAVVGAAGGAAIGSIIPIAGTLVGAGIGALVGGIGGAGVLNFYQKNETAQTIADTAKQNAINYQDYVAATVSPSQTAAITGSSTAFTIQQALPILLVGLALVLTFMMLRSK